LVQISLRPKVIHAEYNGVDIVWIKLSVLEQKHCHFQDGHLSNYIGFCIKLIKDQILPSTVAIILFLCDFLFKRNIDSKIIK